MYNLHLVEERIMSIASKSGLSKNKLLLDAGLNKSVFDNMKKGQIPSIDKIHIIADHLGCSVDYLLGRVSADEQDILQNYHKISPAAKKQIHMIIDNEINAAETVPASSDDVLSQILDTEKGYAQVAAHGGDGVKTIKVANENELDSINDI